MDIEQSVKGLSSIAFVFLLSCMWCFYLISNMSKTCSGQIPPVKDQAKASWLKHGGLFFLSCFSLTEVTGKNHQQLTMLEVFFSLANKLINVGLRETCNPESEMYLFVDR